MERREFEDLVIRVLNGLPKVFKDKLENVDVTIEDEPNMETIKRLGLGSKGHLLGLYQGVPLKARTHYYGMVLPDKIILYKANIERFCKRTGEDIFKKISHVVQHEIGHHFGISDQRLKDIGVY